MPADFPDTRWSLIRRIGGDAAASGALVGCYVDALGRYLRVRLRDVGASRIDDVVQDVLVHLLERPEVLARATPGPGSRFRHYLMALAWNEARNALRRTRRGEGPALDEAMEAGGLIAPEDGMDRAWAASLLAQAWQELRALAERGGTDAEAVLVTDAHLVGGRHLRDLATDHGVSLATASRRLAQGRMLLQQALITRLRQAGELGEQETPAQACDRLLALLR